MVRFFFIFFLPPLVLLSLHPLPYGREDQKKGGEANENNNNNQNKFVVWTYKRQAILIIFFAYLVVIPDYAKMSWSVRADAWDALEPLRDRVVKCLECARPSKRN